METVRGCVNLKKQKSQGNAVEVTVNSKEEILRLLSEFRPRLRPQDSDQAVKCNPFHAFDPVSPSELGPPHPFSRKRVCPPPQPKDEGQTRLRGGGVGSQLGRVEKNSSTLSTLYRLQCSMG
jgi:hypothetical protein